MDQKASQGMELIIIKTGDRYIRVQDDGFHVVQISQASVFPMDEIETARRHETELLDAGFKAISLKKLVLTEEELD